MAGYLTTYGATAILNGTAMPDPLYLAGHPGDPGVDATAADAGETRRLEVALAVAVAGATSNSGAPSMSLAAFTETWTHVSLWDAAAAGNPWWIVALAAPLDIGAGDTITLAAGLLDLSFELWT